MQIGWYHQKYQTGEWDGFNDPGIETFRDEPLVQLARETIQNALDAKGGSNCPVKIVFQNNSIVTESIPCFDEYTNIIRSCAELAKDESKKAVAFFNNALTLLRNEKISILTIEDNNTTGIKGPCESPAPYYAFMKARGLSRKENEIASGSYGIGKFAPYAVSGLRTVFVSTIYQNSNKEHVQLTQGKSILMSHKNDGYNKSAVGFWGDIDGCLPLEGVNNMPTWLLNSPNLDNFSNKQGTKLTVLGFDALSNWSEVILISAMENFFGAILEKKLIVNVGDKYVLDSTTIEDLFTDPQIIDIIMKTRGLEAQERFDAAYGYYLAINATSNDEVIRKQTTNLGLCTLFIIVKDKMPKKVCALRNGMFITDALDGLKRFPDFKDFIAVFQCDNNEGNRMLRDMEPPRHDKFSPERLLEKSEIAKGQKALKEIASWIRGVLKEKARDPISDVTSLDEMKDLLGDDDVDGSNKNGDEINPLGKLIYQGKPFKIISKKYIPHAELDIDEYDVHEDNGDEIENVSDASSGKGKASGAGDSNNDYVRTEAKHIEKPVEINNIRSTIIDKDGKRKLSFIPSESGKLFIRIYESGADNDYSVSIVDSNLGIVNSGCLELDCVALQKVTALIKLNDNFNGAIKVVANEIR